MVNFKKGAVKGKVLYVGSTATLDAIGRFSTFGKDGVFSFAPEYKKRVGKSVFKTPFKVTSKSFNKENVLNFLKKEVGLTFTEFKFL